MIPLYQAILTIFVFYSSSSLILANQNCIPDQPIPHPSDCSKFYICGDKTGEYKCPRPYLFNPYILACDHKENFACLPPNNNRYNNIAQHFGDVVVCAPGAVLPHPTDCSMFIKCGPTDMENLVLECYPPTLFNPMTLSCDLPQRVICSTYDFVQRPTLTEITGSDPTQTETEYVECSPGCFFPHPTECNKFIVCGQTLSENRVYTCPSSLLYNHVTKTCDIALNVVCIKYNYIFNDENNNTIQTNFTEAINLETTTMIYNETDYYNSNETDYEYYFNETSENFTLTTNIVTENITLTTIVDQTTTTYQEPNSTTVEVFNSTAGINETMNQNQTNQTFMIDDVYNTTSVLPFTTTLNNTEFNQTVSIEENFEANSTQITEQEIDDETSFFSSFNWDLFSSLFDF